MWKKWLLALPILFNLLSCEGLTTTGTNDPVSNHCWGISKKNAYSYKFFFELDCPLEKKCTVVFNFLGGGVGDTLDGRCFNGYELKLENAGSSRTVFQNRNYLMSLSENDHVQFSLVDEDNKEKKYDIDLSGIVNSYTVRGDTVDVNVMKQCKISVFTKPHKTEIFGNTISNSLYSFSILDSREPWLGYECSWKQVGPLKKDDLEVYAKLHW